MKVSEKPPTSNTNDWHQIDVSPLVQRLWCHFTSNKCCSFDVFPGNPATQLLPPVWLARKWKKIPKQFSIYSTSRYCVSSFFFWLGGGLEVGYCLTFDFLFSFLYWMIMVPFTYSLLELKWKTYRYCLLRRSGFKDENKICCY